MAGFVTEITRVVTLPGMGLFLMRCSMERSGSMGGRMRRGFGMPFGMLCIRMHRKTKQRGTGKLDQFHRLSPDFVWITALTAANIETAKSYLTRSM
jgi:hypothetical protein